MQTGYNRLDYSLDVERNDLVLYTSPCATFSESNVHVLWACNPKVPDTHLV
jgi:hypothetical protein